MMKRSNVKASLRDGNEDVKFFAIEELARL
jgi:hypothetical protein